MRYVQTLSMSALLLVGTAAADEPSVKFTVIAVTGQQYPFGKFTGFDPNVSINNKGYVAFIGQLTDDKGNTGENICRGNGGGPETCTSGWATPSRAFDGLQINDSGEVFARDRVQGNPPKYFVRAWTPPSNFADIAKTDLPDFDKQFDSLTALGASNNTGGYAFTGLSYPDGQFVLATANGGDSYNFAPWSEPPGVPALSDFGDVVARTGGDTRPTILFDYTLTEFTSVAGPEFSTEGRAPGISDDGQIITFFGDLTNAAAINQRQTGLKYGDGATLTLSSLENGPQILASIELHDLYDAGGAPVKRVLVPLISPSQGFGLIQDSRTSVQFLAGDPSSAQACLAATGPDGVAGVFALPILFLASNGEPAIDRYRPAEILTSGFSRLVAVGDKISMMGASRTVQTLAVYDSVNQRGEVAFSCTTDNGSAVVRASRSRIHLLCIGISDGKSIDGALDTRIVGTAFDSLSRIRITSETLHLSSAAGSTDGPSNLKAISDLISGGDNGSNPNIDVGDSCIIYISTHGSYLETGQEAVKHSVRFDPKDPSKIQDVTGDDRFLIGRETVGGVNKPMRIYDEDLHAWLENGEWPQVNKLVIADFCFSGGFWPSGFGSDSGDLASLDRCAIIAGSTEKEYSSSVSGGSSYLAYALEYVLTQLKDDEVLSFSDLKDGMLSDDTRAYLLNRFGKDKGGNLEFFGAIKEDEDYEQFWGQELQADYEPFVAATDDFILMDGGDPPCYPDFTADGTLDLFDFLGYVNAFNANKPEADCDGTGNLDLFDFLCFVNAFNAGC